MANISTLESLLDEVNQIQRDYDVLSSRFEGHFAQCVDYNDLVRLVVRLEAVDEKINALDDEREKKIVNDAKDGTSKLVDSTMYLKKYFSEK